MLLNNLKTKSFFSYVLSCQNVMPLGVFDYLFVGLFVYVITPKVMKGSSSNDSCV